MFDLFGPSSTQICESIRKSAELQLAIANLLIEKGVFTDEEFQAAHMREIGELDQLDERIRAEG
jgi:hypothetical protein